MPDAEKPQNQLANEKLLHRQVSNKANYSLLARKEGMLLLLADGTIQACNADSDRILGLTAEQLVGQNLLDPKWQFIHEDGSFLLSETHPAIAAQKTGNVVCGFYKPNGELVWLLLSSQPLFQDRGSTPYAIVTTFSDITESKHVQLEGNSRCEPNTQPVAEDTAKTIIPPASLVDTNEFQADQGFAVRDADGQVVRVVGATSDITEQQTALRDRQQIETNLRESEERIRLATTAAELGMWFWDITTNKLIWTEKCKQLFGLKPEVEMDYELFINSVHPEDHQRLNEAIARSFKEKVEYEIEYRSLWSDGSIHWIAAKGRIFYDAEGKAVRMMGTAQDITRRKQIENDLRQRETQLRRLVDSNIIGIMFATPDYITEANEAFLEMVGYTREELLAGKINRQQMTPPEYKALDQQGLEQLLTVGVCNPFEKEYIRKDGSRIPILIGGALVEKDPASWICFILDLTPRKQLEKALRQQAEELKQANRNKDEFLAILSHELRSPLNPILGWSSLLKSRKFDEATTNRALETIERNAQLQIQLIDELLDVSRIIRGKLNLTLATVNLVSVIDAALETVRLIAETKSIQIKIQLDPNVGKVFGDYYRLQQVVGNLLSNAVKFTPANGSVEVSLSLSGEVNSHFALIQVKDTGQGISPEFLPHVFEYFRQADSSTTRKVGGLGLGLAIVRHLVELHGGSVTAASPGIGQGAIFTVRLPVMEESKVAGKRKEAENKFDSSLITGIRILIVDDDADTREFLRFLLQQNGALITVAASVNEALAVIVKTVPDLLISDLGMPERDGYELIQLLRAMPKEEGGEIPAIALTAYAGESDCDRVLAAGFQKHIAKPVQPIKLLTSIADLLRQR
jgi:PAS domain S-box-containing protein